MFLKVSKNKKTGRTYLSMAESYRKAGAKYPSSRTIESFGYLDELEKIYDDPIAYYTEYVSQQNEKQKAEDSEYIIKENKNAILPKNLSARRNLGYIVLQKIYYELGLDRLLNNKQRNRKFAYNTSSILKLLIFSRILAPASKKRTFERKSTYFDFEKNAFSLMDIYRSLSYFAEIEDDIKKHIHNQISVKYGRNTEYVYYDTTNYYFEIDEEDDLRKNGPSKEYRRDPIVQLGLAMDADGIPISYELFPGNESEKLHLRPMIGELVRNYNTGRVIAVADAAQNTGNNIYYLESGKCSYVFSQSVRGADNDIKEFILNEEGYEYFGDEYKRKSRVVRRAINVDFLRPNGDTFKKKVFVDQRQVVFYSKKYADRSKAKREAVLKKAQCIVDNPSAYTKATSYGALRYIENIEVDKKTGEIKERDKSVPYINYKKYMEDEQYDGYYCIVTNIFNDESNKFPDDKIIEIYQGLWRIEDNFRVTKNELCTRPVYVSREDRIHAHFLICYIALVILRLIHKRLHYAMSTEKIIDTLSKINCSPETKNLYLFDYRSDESDLIGEIMGFDFTKKRLTRGEIRKIIGSSKI